jgi:hypothetical protein
METSLYFCCGEMDSEQENEQSIISESPEIDVGENPAWVSGLFSAFPAFQNNNYRLYFFGQLISLTGT